MPLVPRHSALLTKSHNQQNQVLWTETSGAINRSRAFLPKLDQVECHNSVKVKVTGHITLFLLKAVLSLYFYFISVLSAYISAHQVHNACGGQKRACSHLGLELHTTMS